MTHYDTKYKNVTVKKAHESIIWWYSNNSKV